MGNLTHLPLDETGESIKKLPSKYRIGHDKRGYYRQIAESNNIQGYYIVTMDNLDERGNKLLENSQLKPLLVKQKLLNCTYMIPHII